MKRKRITVEVEDLDTGDYGKWVFPEVHNFEVAHEPTIRDAVRTQWGIVDIETEPARVTALDVTFTLGMDEEPADGWFTFTSIREED